MSNHSRASLVLAAVAIASVMPAHAQQPAASAAPVKLGIVSFLTGPAASPFGIPGRNGAEIVIEAFNAGKAPAPFNQVGLGGAKIEAKYVDEAGTVANGVTEFRNLVQRDQVDAVVGYVSSGSCLAVTPVAEELKALTVLYDCGTPRIFEEKARSYVFRVSPHATMDSIGAARYLLAKKKNLTSFSGINQNYAWGQDSWRDFLGAMKVLAPKVEVDKVLFPKLFVGEYGAEVSTLLTSKSQALHTSFYDGDLEAFVYQEQARGLDKRMTIIMTTGEAAIWRLRDLARQEGLDPAFWRAGPGLLKVYGDLGLTALPLGSDGLPLPESPDETPEARQYLVCVAERDLSALLPMLPQLANNLEITVPAAA